MQGGLEGDAGFLAGEHHLGDIGHFAALIGVGEALGLGLDILDPVERGFQRIAEAARRAGALRRGLGALLGRADLLEQLPNGR